MPRKRKRVGAFKDDFLSVYILGNCRILYIQRAHPACFSKLCGALRGMTATLAVHYIYTGASGKESMAADIISFVLGIGAAFGVSFLIMKNRTKKNRLCESISIICTVIICLLFTIFTFMPPLTPLFKDATNGTYGIQAKEKRRSCRLPLC